MKKFLFVLAIGAFAACNNSASTEAKTDSTHVDSTKMTVDSTKMSVDTASKMSADTTKKDTATKKQFLYGKQSLGASPENGPLIRKDQVKS